MVQRLDRVVERLDVLRGVRVWGEAGPGHPLDLGVEVAGPVADAELAEPGHISLFLKTGKLASMLNIYKSLSFEHK